MNTPDDYVPMNRGVAYVDMTPQEKQAYHARIRAARTGGQDGLVRLGAILLEIMSQGEDNAA